MDTQNSMISTQSPSTHSDSSKTGSSKSVAKDDNVEIDLTKDNVSSPIDLECHIQAERITKIMNECIYKTKLSICLPELVHEFRTLNSILSPHHMDDLIFIFEQYENPLFSASLLNMAAMEDIKGGDVSLKNRLNPELGHLIYIMNSYPDLIPVVEQMISQMIADFNKEGNRTNEPIAYLLKFEQFKELMIRQMDLSAGEELATKINTRKLEASNTKLVETIKELTVTLKEETEAFESTMKKKADVIAKLEQELHFLAHDASIKLKKKILDSDRQMVLMTRAHAVKAEMLKEEEVEMQDGYDMLLGRNLVDEKSQRARRFKVETQLLSWLQKYDLEMGDKQVELDDFTDKYDEEVKKCDELEEKLAEQDKEYLPLMAEREEEYHQEMTDKMNKFLLEHAARVIQNAWREVLFNRAEKRRLKKLQKKMQLAKEAAERAAKKAEIAAKKAAKKAG